MGDPLTFVFGLVHDAFNANICVFGSDKSHITKIEQGDLMHWADIVCALQKAGYSQRRLAQELGLKDASTVSRVIRRTNTSYNVATKIAEVTGIPLRRLFPDGRYNQPPARDRRALPAPERRTAA